MCVNRLCNNNTFSPPLDCRFAILYLECLVFIYHNEFQEIIDEIKEAVANRKILRQTMALNSLIRLRHLCYFLLTNIVLIA